MNTKILSTLFLGIFLFATSASAATRIWDGGGADNNWSTAANWSGDTIPTGADDVVFDGTSTKNATVDAALTVNTVSINSGYAGTITQNAVLTVTNAFTQSAGTFQGTAANANFGTLILNVGSGFVAPSGTLSVTSQTAYEVFNFNGGTFSANGGTFSVNGRSDLNYFRYQPPTFNNLIVNKPLTILNASIVVNGNLTLNEVLSNSTVDVNGDVTFASGYTSGSAVLNFGGTAARAATLNGAAIGNPITINNPNLTLTTSQTSGNVVWNQKVTIQAGTLNQSTADYTFNVSAGFNSAGLNITGGIFNGGAGKVILNTSFGITSGTFTGGAGDVGTNIADCPAYPQQNYYFQQSGGTFNGGSGGARFCDLRRTGGSFIATSGNMTILNYGDFTGGTFAANNGTLTVENNVTIIAPGFTLNNVTLKGANNHGFAGTPKPIINGTLNLDEGNLGSDVAVNGAVIYGVNFTGGGGRLFFEGTATRTINLPARNILLGMMLDNPNLTVTTSGAGASAFTGEVEVKRGLLQQGNQVLTLNSTLRVSGGTFQGGAAALTNNGTYINIIVSGGTFQSGAGAISVGTINTSGGTFNGGSGDIEVARYEQSGGTFNAPTGTITVIADWTHPTSGTFNAGTGSVKLTGYNVYNCANSYGSDVNVTETFYNLEIANSFCNRRFIFAGDTLIVNNDLRLTAAAIEGGKIRPLGTTTIEASNNGYRGSTIIEYVTPNRNFVINNPASVVNMLPVEMNAANSTLTSTGAGQINFGAMTLLNGTLNQPNAVWDFTTYPGYAQSGGIFNGSAAQVNGANALSGGVFNGGTGLVNGGWTQSGGTFSTAGDMNVGALTLTGGTFNAPLGILDIYNGFGHTGGGTFNARTGTVRTSTRVGVYQSSFDVNATETFNNLEFNGTNNNANHGIAANDTLIVNGTLNFNGRGVNGGSIVANGEVHYNSYGAYQNATTLVKFEDAATRTVTLCTDTAGCPAYFSNYTQPMLINNPNITINSGLNAGGGLIVPGLDLRQGTFNQGAGRLGITTYNQSGGTFNGGTFNDSPSQNGINDFTLSGGDFNPAPKISFSGKFTHTAAGGNFNEGTGSVSFDSTYNGAFGSVDVNESETFYNLGFGSGNGTNIAAGDRLIVNGTTVFGSGALNGGTVDAKANVSVLNQFLGGTTNLTFSGAVNQTFTNTGGITTGGAWTINKPNSTPLAENSYAPAAPTTLLLSGNVGSAPLNSYPTFNIASGNVVQTGNFNHAFGSLALANGTSFVNEFGGTLALSGNLTNNGSINFDGNGSGCPQADAIVVRSSIAGTQRQWSGAGRFRLVDVNLKDQSATQSIIVYSGTDAGNNTNFVFSGGCLAPTAATAGVGGKIVNASGRGINRVRVIMVDADGNTRFAATNAFGKYRFADVPVGQTVTILIVRSKHKFASYTQILNVTDDTNSVDFQAQ